MVDDTKALFKRILTAFLERYRFDLPDSITESIGGSRTIMSDIELPPTLIAALRDLITQARQQASRSVNTIQVQTYWQIGRTHR